MTQFAPPYQPRGNSPLDLALFINQLTQRGKPQAAQGSGAGLDSLIGGGAGAGGVSMLGGGGVGAAGAGAADMGIAAPSMMMPEIGASTGGAGTVGGTVAGLSPMMGMAGVVAAPLIGSMLGKAMIGKNPYKSREYSSEDFGKRSNLAIKGFDKTDEATRRQIGDKLREYKGKRPLTTALDKIDGSASSKGEWNFQLPDVAQMKVNKKLFNTEKGWGGVGTQQNLMKQHSAMDLFDMGKDALNRKHRDEIGGILGQVDELIKKGQGAGLSPQPQKVVPMGHTVQQIMNMRKR